MAVLANSEGSSVPPEMQQNLEVDDEYKYTPSADYNSTSGRIFRNKKFTKKRHESKARRTAEEDVSNICCSDEDYPQSSKQATDLQLHRSIPKMMSTINQTIKKMTLKDNSCSMPSFTHVLEEVAVDQSTAVGMLKDCSSCPSKIEEIHQQAVAQCIYMNSSSSNLQTQAQGKRRRHRRKQQYKRMAVDVLNDKKSLLLKMPTSNSSEDSGIGKRKRNIILADNTDVTMLNSAMGGSVCIPVPVSNFAGQSVSQQELPEQHWQDDTDAVMMDCDDLESSSMTQLGGNPNSQGILITEEESGESDTQNDDIESLSDHNQDADDEESDYYNNDSSTTSLSESSFTILNHSKKFIPVHSREIRSGRRRLKNSNLNTIENEELSKFLQSPKDTVLKMCPSTEKERQDFINVASLYSLSYEEVCDQDERVWVQFTKTPKTTTQRRNDLIKAGDRSTFNNFTEGSSLAPLFDTIVSEKAECDERIDDSGGNVHNNVTRGGVGINQSVNSKRIKKGC